MKNCFKLLIFILKYLAFWIVCFFFFRAVFLLYNYRFSADLSFVEIMGTFRYGFVMDLATATYFTFFPILVCLSSPFVRSKILYTIIFVFTVAILGMSSFLGLLDIALYAEWGTRLSPQILPALQNPKGMLACVTTTQLIILLLVEVGIVAGFLFLYSLLFKTHKKQEKSKWWNIPVLLLYSAILIIPMRGGLQITPINFSSVYFSSHLFANHAATNPYWAFTHRMIYSDKNVKAITFMDSNICEELIGNALKDEQEDIPFFITSKNGKPVNVVLIILESFSNKVIEPLGGAEGVTPNFNNLTQEGILFSNFYACGQRSDKGIAALMATYPALVGPYSILYFPEKMKKIDYLSHYFNKKNYKTHFYYAGEAEFYNMKNLIFHSEYDQLVTVKDFPSSAKQQNWGVPDALFYERITDDLKNFSTPFFLVTYNISSHPPYDIPNITERNYAQAVAYSDKWLGNFVAQLKQHPCWEHTLLIITSDHGTLDFVSTSYSNPQSHQIPMLWIGGVIDTAFVNTNFGMQTDLTATLAQQLSWERNQNPFSKNLFGKKEYAFYFNYNGFGFASPQLTYHYDMDLDNIEFFHVNNEQKKDSLLQFSKAFVQYLHSDFRKR